MPISPMKLMWALLILALLSVAAVNAASPSPAPAFSPASMTSHAKAVSPAPLSTAVSPALSTPPATVMPPTPAMSPGPDCMTQIFNMTDCLSYVTEGSNVTKPDPNCCPELAGMLDSNPTCLCTMLGKSSDLPVKLDLKRALKLPSVCGLQTPPISMCSLVGIPIPAPLSSAMSPGAPSSTPGSGMAMAPGSMGGGEGEAPSAGANGASGLNSYMILPFLTSASAIALLTL